MTYGTGDVYEVLSSSRCCVKIVSIFVDSTPNRVYGGTVSAMELDFLREGTAIDTRAIGRMTGVTDLAARRLATAISTRATTGVTSLRVRL